VLLGCSVVALAAVACGADDPAPLAASGVGIIAEGCSLVAQLGSGVVLGDGVVVTVAHTIAGATSVVVEDHEGTEHVAVVVAFDPDADLAVLDVPTLDSPPLAVGPVHIADATLLRWDRDDGVEAVGVEVSKRLEITIEDIYNDDIVQRSGLEVIGPVEPGDSGGPVVDSAGAVIGIVYANSRHRDGVGFATDVTEIERVLAAVVDATNGPADNGRCF
jgi:S1-C subfamily serine protease